MTGDSTDLVLPTGPLDGRAAAYYAVLNVLRRRTFVGETLALLRERDQLDGREAGLAQEIALGATRHLLTLQRVLRTVARYNPARTQPEIKALLLTGAQQIIYLDRVPEFAAVNETVALARRGVAPRAAGMVNAILRNLVRAIETRRTSWEANSPLDVRVGWDAACKFKQALFPQPTHAPLAHVAAAAGERLPRLRQLVQRFGEQAATGVAWNAQALPPTVLQRARGRSDADAFIARVRAEFGADAECTGDAAFLPATVNVLESPLFREGCAFVQDPTARQVVDAADVQPGDRILDLCAAPGGKSVALADRLGDRGEIVACDVSPRRLIQVRANAERMELGSIRAALIEPGADELPVEGDFDVALADVPCSNTGVIARRPEARLGFNAGKLRSLTALQRQLIRRAAARVRPGGQLIYSTCCLEPEECDAVVEDFLQEQSDWHCTTAQLTLPKWGAQLSDWCDGGYVARLVRQE